MRRYDRWYWNWPWCLINPLFWAELYDGALQFMGIGKYGDRDGDS